MRVEFFSRKESGRLAPGVGGHFSFTNFRPHPKKKPNPTYPNPGGCCPATLFHVGAPWCIFVGAPPGQQISDPVSEVMLLSPLGLQWQFRKTMQKEFRGGGVVLNQLG